VTDLPIQRYEKVINPTEEQRALLDELRAASDRGSELVKQACPADMPLTPVARLDVMEKRLRALDDAINLVQPPLVKLYGTLSDEQKRRLEEEVRPAAKAGRKGYGDLNVTALCTGEGLTNLPLDEIERTVKPDGRQRAELDKFKNATARASDVLKETCPQEMPSSLPGRLSAVEKRIAGLNRAINVLRPAAGSFYASLSDEQKARFTSMRPSASAQTSPTP
jgi:hypothetical protein